MATNQFEDSRIAGGTLNRGAQTVGKTARVVEPESSAISRDDVRDGVEKPLGNAKSENTNAAKKETPNG